MNYFFLVFFTIYGGMHAYAFLKARAALGFGAAAGSLLAVFMLVMTASLVLIRFLERNEYELAARALSYLGYLWMAALFLFVCGSVVVDLLNLVLRAAGRAGWTDAASMLIPAKQAFIAISGLAAAICVYGYVEALHVRTEHVRIETAKLPAGTERLVIAQISDVHLGLIVRCDRLVGILEKVHEAKPDLLLSTGDLVDAQIDHLPGLRELLQEVMPRYGKFAITGNHEYYAGIEKSIEFTKRSGFTLLHGGAKDIGPLIIAGVDDRTAAQVQAGRPKPDREVLGRLDRKKFILFMKHQPHPDADAIGLFDLMLSGHTHKGQIWPFTLLSKRVHPLHAGRYEVGKGSVVYTSRGSGTWGPPVRFLAPPQVTIIELLRKQ